MKKSVLLLSGILVAAAAVAVANQVLKPETVKQIDLPAAQAGNSAEESTQQSQPEAPATSEKDETSAIFSPPNQAGAANTASGAATNDATVAPDAPTNTSAPSSSPADGGDIEPTQS